MPLWNRSHRVRVVVYGTHSADWMDALAPKAAVWSGMAGEIADVVHVDGPRRMIPWLGAWGRRTVLLPLMEDHVASRPRRYAALVPSPTALATLRDKAAFAAYARSHSLAGMVPAIYPTLDDAVFPCVIKRTDLNSGQGVEVAETREQAERLLAGEPFLGRACLFQALVVKSVEYVAHCVCKEGRMLWHRVYASEPPTGATIRRSAPAWRHRPASVSGRVLESLESFLTPLAYSGPCNIDFAIDAGGRVIVFEINPRLGGSLMLSENVDDLRECLSCILRNAV